MPKTPDSIPSQWARVAAYESWAKTENRAARTKPGRDALEAKFLAQAGGDPKRAASARKAHFRRMALRSAEVRRARKAGGDDAA